MIDDTDRKLIELLTRDGRRPYTEIAQQLEVSEATVRTRVARLQELDILRIVALCNPLTLGHQSVRLMISVRDHSPRAVAKNLAEMAMVNHVALGTGARDIYIEATCRDLDQLVTLLDDVRRLPGVADIDELVLLELFKDYSWVGLQQSAGQNPT
ncbi:Lrp/AsnC family transcriptional regulator [Leifsonia poae]|uniref:Lrp/AsnC family transcriptional regulator n=1 Tax=Leifsonia poae TaxID=110933 RepID=UPI001CBA8B4C|nr:Lrp/AsnC family transcriptional regulator [Leifsonia poae]